MEHADVDDGGQINKLWVRNAFISVDCKLYFYILALNYILQLWHISMTSEFGL